MPPAERRPGRLAAIVLVAIFVWLVLLPWISRWPGQAAYLDHLEATGIDPSAMYYTDIPPEYMLDHAGRSEPQ